MILDQIIEKKRLRLAQLDKDIFNNVTKDNYTDNKFLNRLKQEKFTIIGEFKKASPSKGIIAAEFSVDNILCIYEELPIGAYSVLTEEDYFLGNNEYLRVVSQSSKRPTLRKDFIIDKYQIYEAKALGASAVLLIVAVLGEKIKEYIEVADELGLATLVEVHNENELDIALKVEVEIIGINNRDLKTFTVDLKTTERLMKYIPKDKVVISESGIKNIEDIKYLKSLGVKGVLIGETLMRNLDNKDFVRSLKEFSCED